MNEIAVQDVIVITVMIVYIGAEMKTVVSFELSEDIQEKLGVYETSVIIIFYSHL